MARLSPIQTEIMDILRTYPEGVPLDALSLFVPHQTKCRIKFSLNDLMRRGLITMNHNKGTYRINTRTTSS
ncbi:MAG: hypothetical protein DRO11_05520 [Methanobacteriota archaeon]|nr:MAG: hypothetical protein DRO11_05520 [Euryarchaeota archaeon]